MRPFLIIIVSIFIIVLFFSCRPFCQCEPITMAYFECRIINPQGQNLVFGSQALYKIDSIKVLQKRNDFSVHNASVRKSYKDSANLFFDFYVPQAKSFIYYNQLSASDSLEIRWADKKQKCCGEPFIYHSIEEVKFNGTIVQPQNGVYYLVN